MSTTKNVELNATDEEILDEIREHGRASVSLLDQTISKTEQYIRQRVKRMREHDILIEVAPRIYDLYERRQEYEARGITIEQ